MTAWPGAAAGRKERGKAVGAPGPVVHERVPFGTLDGGAASRDDPLDLEEAAVIAHDLSRAVSTVVLDSPGAVTVAVCAAVSGGHLLIEDVPGTGKTILAHTVATALGAGLSRIQGHTDLLPTDVTGVSVYSPETGDWEFHPGPVFGHVVLLDELNRTPPRTQSALLEAMAEGQVTVDGARWPLPSPHLVVATQNPVGQLGTFPLVESQLDRFALSCSLGYPDAETELRLALGEGGQAALAHLQPVCTTASWARLVQACTTVQVAMPVAEYAVQLCRATRDAASVRLGASPRGSITLVRSAQAHALVEGRSYATPADVQVMAVPVLAHRIVGDGGPEHDASLVHEVLRTTPVPRP